MLHRINILKNKNYSINNKKNITFQKLHMNIWLKQTSFSILIFLLNNEIFNRFENHIISISKLKNYQTKLKNTQHIIGANFRPSFPKNQTLSRTFRTQKAPTPHGANFQKTHEQLTPITLAVSVVRGVRS